MSFSGISGAIFSQVAGILIQQYGWRCAYLVLAAIGLTIYLAAVVFLIKTPEQKGVTPYGYEPELAEAANTRKEETAVEKEGTSFAEASKSSTLYFMFAFMMCLVICYCENQFISPFASSELHMTVTAAATMQSVYCIGYVLGNTFFGAFADRVSNKMVLTSGIGVIVLSQCLLLASRDAAALGMAASLITGFGLSLYTILPPIMTKSIFGDKDYSKIWAYLTSAGVLVGAVAMPVMGWIYDKTGSYSMVFYGLIALALASLVFGQLSLKKSK